MRGRLTPVKLLLQQADLSKFQRDRVAHRDPAAGPLGGTGSLTPVFILNVKTTVGTSVKESIGDDLYTILQNYAWYHKANLLQVFGFFDSLIHT